MEKVLESLRQTIVEQFEIGGPALQTYNEWFSANVICDGEKIILTAFANAIRKARELTGRDVQISVLSDIWFSWNAELREHNICIIVPDRGVRFEALGEKAIFVIDLHRNDRVN